MTINIENKYSEIKSDNIFDDFEPYELARLVFAEGLRQHSCPYECEINLILTDNEEIRQLNKDFRGIDKATDVLSFPMLDYEKPCTFDMVSENNPIFFNPENQELMLGDIIISVEKAQAQAEEYGHSLKREFAFLIAHSILHLLGYDHMVEAERLEMELLQERILDSVGITR